MSLAYRSLSSLFWNILVSPFTVGILFLRSVILARLLPVEVFGVYSFAGSIILLTSILPNFGMGDAFLHRSAETQDENHAAAVHFTLKLVFTLVWAAMLLLGSFFIEDTVTRQALIWMTVSLGALELTQTPMLILTRRIVHRRLALLHILNAFLTTLVAVFLASNGITLWALLATDYVTLFLTIILLYVWRPVWRTSLAWSPSAMRYFVRFGSRSFLAGLLQQSLDRVDDLWTGLFLGNTALGFYSRAYTFATYPRRVLASPVNQVTRGTYAELKEDRHRLSQAFLRINALLVRSGFLFGGFLALTAPEIITLLLGAKWLPMLTAFRLMLVYTLFDPLKMSIAYAFVAVGHPEKVVRTRFIQLVVMIIGLVFLGPRYNIAGVALAVDLMLVVGIALLLWQARAHVDFSLRRLFLVPSLALFIGLLIGRAVLEIPLPCNSDWCTATLKSAAFILTYGLILLFTERAEIFKLLHFLRTQFPSRTAYLRSN